MHYSTAKVQRQAGFFAISGLSFVYFDEAFYAEHFNYNSHRLSRQENHLLYIKMYKNSFDHDTSFPAPRLICVTFHQAGVIVGIFPQNDPAAILKK